MYTSILSKITQYSYIVNGGSVLNNIQKMTNLICDGNTGRNIK